MAYGEDWRGSARRHLTAASSLFAKNKAGEKPGNQAVAGYLFGLAGELAWKEMMRKTGMRPGAVDHSEDPFYAHFPNLRRFLKVRATGRAQAQLLAHASNDALFREWDTKMRYAPTPDIPEANVAAWKLSAEGLVGQMDLT